MYSPLRPNNYWNMKYEDYVQRRKASTTAESLPTPHASLAQALSSSAAVPPASLGAEALHELRVKRSAALGVKRAVELQKETLEMAHKKKRLEGSDARSQISQLLGKMSGGGGSASATTSEGPAPPTNALIFAPSSLAAGGFVMTEREQAPAAEAKLHGRPSSTLLVRFHGAHSPLAGVSAETMARLEREAAFAGTLFAALLEGVRGQCGRHGTVRSAQAYVLREGELRTVRERVAAASGAAPGAVDAAAMVQERLRLLVRFDTVTDALKAGEVLCQQNQWVISFFPTTSYDSGHFGPTDGEQLVPL